MLVTDYFFCQRETCLKYSLRGTDGYVLPNIKDPVPNPAILKPNVPIQIDFKIKG